MPGATAAERLHYALPDWRTALKKRVKRPRRPSFYEVWCMFWMFIWGMSAFFRLLQAQWLHGAIDLALVGVYRFMWVEVRRHHIMDIWLWMLPAPFLVLVIVIPG